MLSIIFDHVYAPVKVRFASGAPLELELSGVVMRLASAIAEIDGGDVGSDAVVRHTIAESSDTLSCRIGTEAARMSDQP